MNMYTSLIKNIENFHDEILKIDRFLTGTRVSYSFFKDKFPELLEKFGEKERDDEEKEGLEIFKQLNKSVDSYEVEILTFCFINLIARTEAFLNDILETVYLWKNSELSEIDRQKKILKFSHSSFKDKVKFLNNKFGLVFPAIEKHKSTIIELMSTRNIILHNNGYVNETYLRLNKTSKQKIGERSIITEDYLKLTFIVVILIAKDTESVIKEKMNNASS